jgi:hypothetical protein
MAVVYRTRHATGHRPDAFVVHCSDPRYQGHFHDFLTGHLGLHSYGLIVAPGGPQLLRAGALLPKFAWAGWRWAKFLMDIARPPRVILIGHDDCRWYTEGPFRHVRGESKVHVIADLRAVREEILERFPAVAVELYFARLDGDNAVIEGV